MRTLPSRGASPRVESAEVELLPYGLRSAKIRLTIPEAYDVHRRMIEWDARYSHDRIPDQALGTDALSVKSMRWVLESWPRVQRIIAMIAQHRSLAAARSSEGDGHHRRTPRFGNGAERGSGA